MSLQQSNISLEMRRKRACFRAWHRGTKEMDIILGGFADQAIETLNEADLTDFEALLEVSDAELFSWLLGKEKPSADYDTNLFHHVVRFYREGGAVHHAL